MGVGDLRLDAIVLGYRTVDAKCHRLRLSGQARVAQRSLAGCLESDREQAQRSSAPEPARPYHLFRSRSLRRTKSQPRATPATAAQQLAVERFGAEVDPEQVVRYWSPLVHSITQGSYARSGCRLQPLRQICERQQPSGASLGHSGGGGDAQLPLTRQDIKSLPGLIWVWPEERRCSRCPRLGRPCTRRGSSRARRAHHRFERAAVRGRRDPGSRQRPSHRCR